MQRSTPISACSVLVALLVTLLALFVPAPAWAFTPPPMTGHVTDAANKLTAGERDALGTKLAAYRKCSRNEIAVFVAGSLDGAPIEDVAYTTFNTWKLGKSGADSGVLLLVAPTERKVRIEVGKGLDGTLPDLKTNDILREHVSPNMKQGRVFAALDEGTTEIGKVLGGCAITPAASASPSSSAGAPSPPASASASGTPGPTAPTESAPAAPEPFFDGITKMRLWMALAVSLLTIVAAIGARAAWQVGAFVSLWTGLAFGLVTSNVVSGATYAKVVDEQLGWFALAMVALVIANIAAWVSRRYQSSSEGVGTSDYSSGSSSTTSTTSDPWPSSSSSSGSSGSSFGSTDNGSSFTGGGGSSGGAGSSDSY